MDSLSGYRYIVLLKEAGNLFERMNADPLYQQLVRVGPYVAESQDGEHYQARLDLYVNQLMAATLISLAEAGGLCSVLR